jgi:serine/threonine-protein kinase
MSGDWARLAAALAGRFTLDRELGQGGMATVYLAEDLKHKRKVALKVLKPELAAVLGAERRPVHHVRRDPRRPTLHPAAAGDGGQSGAGAELGGEARRRGVTKVRR